MLRCALLLFVATPLAAWFVVKPVRVVAPHWLGAMGAVPIECPSATLCLDDPRQLDDARELQSLAIAFVNEKVGRLREVPRMVFCTTVACAEAFGLHERAAVTMGTYGMVFSPRAWHDHLVRHELIHHLQAERLGLLRLMRKPQWFVEGMAYALSDDPRDTLIEPFDSQRRRFQQWYQGIDPRFLWSEALRP
jgi:hypothetical protein